MSLAQRSVASTAWNVAANLTTVAAFALRSILLARMLPVDVFGVYGLAGSIIALSVLVANFGMGGAYLHRDPVTKDEIQAAAIHFTLKLVFTLIWAVLMVAGTLLFTVDPLRTALLALTVTTTGLELTQTAQLILVRRVVHRRLALLQVLNAILTTVVALGLAWQGATLWALLATDGVTLVLTVALLHLWRPVWRPRLAWSRPEVRYFLRFGSRSFPAAVLLKALDRIDDLWTGLFLGTGPLGYYSKAYAFATYPRAILAAPVNAVAMGTYAELKENRHQLSQAFFRSNAILVRSGFYLAGLLALIAPEFIRLALGEKWLPMLDAFRLMLVFTLFDPIKTTVANLFVAVGRPEQVVKARVVQLAVLIAGLFSLGWIWGIAGVALAVDVMLLIGIAILLWQAREHVSFSPTRLFAVPGLALLVGIGLALGVSALPAVTGSDWRTGFAKLTMFSIVYGGILGLLERQQLAELFALLARSRSPGRRSAPDEPPHF